MKNAKVLMLGTEISSKGGIASVVTDYFDFGIMSRLNIEYRATYRDGSSLSKILFYLKQAPLIIARMFSADIVHAHVAQKGSFWRLASLLYVAHLLRRKTVMHIHGSQFDNFYRDSSSVVQAIIRYSLRTNDVVIALSQDWKKTLLSIEPSTNVVVLRNGISPEKYRCTGERELHLPVNVLSLGLLGERKGSYDLVKSVQYTKAFGYQYVIAGNGEVEQVKALVNEEQLEEFIQIPGWVGPEKKQELLDAADIYVLPSYHEGLPISILEAMAAGLPVVSTPVGGIAEAVIDGETGRLVPPGDPVALAEAIQSIASDPVSWKKMGEAAVSLIEEQFSLATVEKELQSIFDSLREPSVASR